MKKLLFIMAFFPLFSFGQNDEINALLYSIKDKYTVQDGNIVVQKILEFNNITKDNIYMFIKEYMANIYGSLKEVLQVDDRENGAIIIKGLYANIYCDEFLFGSAVRQDVWHVLKCEIKENRVRITISMNKIDVYAPAGGSGAYYHPPKNYIEYLTSYYPIDDGDRAWAVKKTKAREGYIFYKAINKAVDTINAINVFVKKSSSIEKVSDDW